MINDAALCEDADHVNEFLVMINNGFKIDSTLFIPEDDSVRETQIPTA